MKTYTGTRTAAGCAVTVTDGGTSRALDPRFDLRTHSPDGFEWGYGGSGPAQLALALAADVLADDEAALGRLPAAQVPRCWPTPCGGVDAHGGRTRRCGPHSSSTGQ